MASSSVKAARWLWMAVTRVVPLRVWLGTEYLMTSCLGLERSTAGRSLLGYAELTATLGCAGVDGG